MAHSNHLTSLRVPDLRVLLLGPSVPRSSNNPDPSHGPLSGLCCLPQPPHRHRDQHPDIKTQILSTIIAKAAERFRRGRRRPRSGTRAILTVLAGPPVTATVMPRTALRKATSQLPTPLPTTRATRPPPQQEWREPSLRPPPCRR
jgi:hypothetical protein